MDFGEPSGGGFIDQHFDFKQCQRPDGTIYGSRGECAMKGSKEVKPNKGGEGGGGGNIGGLNVNAKFAVDSNIKEQSKKKVTKLLDSLGTHSLRDVITLSTKGGPGVGRTSNPEAGRLLVTEAYDRLTKIQKGEGKTPMSLTSIARAEDLKRIGINPDKANVLGKQGKSIKGAHVAIPKPPAPKAEKPKAKPKAEKPKAEKPKAKPKAEKPKAKSKPELSSKAKADQAKVVKHLERELKTAKGMLKAYETGGINQVTVDSGRRKVKALEERIKKVRNGGEREIKAELNKMPKQPKAGPKRVVKVTRPNASRSEMLAEWRNSYKYQREVRMETKDNARTKATQDLINEGYDVRKLHRTPSNPNGVFKDMGMNLDNIDFR